MRSKRLDRRRLPFCCVCEPFLAPTNRRCLGHASGILRLEGVSAIPWIQPFLATADDNAAEAALAIAGTHSPEGFNILRECFLKSSDPWCRSVLLSAITLTRQDAALEFLLDLVSSESLNAEAAIEAILRSMPSSEVMKRLGIVDQRGCAQHR